MELPGQAYSRGFDTALRFRGLKREPLPDRLLSLRLLRVQWRATRTEDGRTLALPGSAHPFATSAPFPQVGQRAPIVSRSRGTGSSRPENFDTFSYCASRLEKPAAAETSNGRVKLIPTIACPCRSHGALMRRRATEDSRVMAAQIRSRSRSCWLRDGSMWTWTTQP